MIASLHSPLITYPRWTPRLQPTSLWLLSACSFRPCYSWPSYPANCSELSNKLFTWRGSTFVTKVANKGVIWKGARWRGNDTIIKRSLMSPTTNPGFDSLNVNSSLTQHCMSFFSTTFLPVFDTSRLWVILKHIPHTLDKYYILGERTQPAMYRNKINESFAF